MLLQRRSDMFRRAGDFVDKISEAMSPLTPIAAVISAANRAYSITSSARASNIGGIVRPSACAVIRFTTRSNLVGCSIGMSAGFAPRKILNPAGVDTGLPPSIKKVRSITHKTASRDVFAHWIHCRDRMAPCQRDNLIATGAKKTVAGHQQRVSSLLNKI
jgi:hypothetical protein